MSQTRSAETTRSTQASKEAKFSNESLRSGKKLEHIGEAALGINQATGEKLFIDADSAMNFEQDRRNENLRQLEAFSAPQHIVDCYKRISRSFPDIRNVKLRQDFNRNYISTLAMRIAMLANLQNLRTISSALAI